jgi:5-hydroxyisourate hydrolase
MSQITTHILDTSSGKPAAGIKITLFSFDNPQWRTIDSGVTNKDGRLNDLIEDTRTLPPGIYKLKFETRDYFDRRNTETFYPYIEITFQLSEREHYHVPLLLTPFGYTTYRGS